MDSGAEKEGLLTDSRLLNRSASELLALLESALRKSQPTCGEGVRPEFANDLDQVKDNSTDAQEKIREAINLTQKELIDKL